MSVRRKYLIKIKFNSHRRFQLKFHPCVIKIQQLIDLRLPKRQTFVSASVGVKCDQYNDYYITCH
jgi:hypothetical protein